MYQRPKIGIIIGTTRPGRFADVPTQWLIDRAQQRRDAEFEIVDLRDYPMPFFEERQAPAYVAPSDEGAKRFAAKMASLDGYIFVTAEYNHSISGVLKNALDHLYAEVQRKPATFIGYGATGASRAVEHLRHILAELQVATLKYTVHLTRAEMLGVLREGKAIDDFPYLGEAAGKLLDEIVWWATTLRAGRERQSEAA